MVGNREGLDAHPVRRYDELSGAEGAIRFVGVSMQINHLQNRKSCDRVFSASGIRREPWLILDTCSWRDPPGFQLLDRSS